MLKGFYRLLLCMLLGIMLVGCSSSSSDSVESKSVEMDEAPVYDEETGMVTEDNMDMSLETPLNRKVIKTGNLYIETKAFEQSFNHIMETVETLGGFTESSMVRDTGGVDVRGERRADLVVRLPQEAFETFINGASAYGFVAEKSIKGEDITDQYMDVERRLETLEVQAERLTALLTQAGDLEDLFAIEQELAQVTYEIETYKGTKNKYDSLVDYATIDIYLRETLEYEERQTTPVTLWEKIVRQFTNSVKALGELAEGALLIFIALLPFIIIALPIVWIGYQLYRRLIKQSKQSRKTKTEDKDSVS